VEAETVHLQLGEYKQDRQIQAVVVEAALVVAALLDQAEVV
jgi:hypothetical protein